METTLETWVNPTQSIVVTVKTDHLGQETHTETKPGQKLAITVEDRKMNQERASKEKYDPFTNGLLAPIQIVDKDAAEKASKNPNQLTEEDLQSLLAATPKEFATRLMAINSEAVLRRLRKVARDADIKPSRQEMIQSRLTDVSPSAKIESGDVASDIPSERRR